MALARQVRAVKQRLNQVAAGAQLGVGKVDLPVLIAVLLGAAVGATAVVWLLRRQQR